MSFPTFVKIQGSDEMTLKNEESYKKLTSGVFFEDIYYGNKGNKINRANQQVTIMYSYIAQDTKILRNKRFKNLLENFADELNFKEDITEAMYGMKSSGQRRIIIPPEINRSGEYRILDVLLLSIKADEVNTSKEKTKKVLNDEEEEPKEKTEPVKENTPNENVPSDNNGYSKTTIGSIAVAAIGAPAVVLQIIREIKSSASSSYALLKETETLLPKIRISQENIYPPQNTYIKMTKPEPQLPSDEQSTYPSRNMTYTNYETKPQPQPNQKHRVGPKITYQIVDEGEGEVIRKYQQGCCFQYKKNGSTEAISFEGSPAGLAVQLCPGYEEAIHEAIVGMKLNGRRIIFIPAGVSDLGEDIVLDLKLTALNPMSRM